MTSGVFGPLDSLIRAWNSKDIDAIQIALDSYIHALDTDYYDNKGKFTTAHDNVIRFLYGRIDSGIICDEIGCNMPQLEARARQLGKPSPNEALREDHVQAVINMTERGATDSQIAQVLGFGICETVFTSSEKEAREMRDAVKQFGKQGSLGL